MGPERQARGRAIAAIAGRQHGVVARRQLLASGLSAKAIRARIASGHLHRVNRGVYAVGHARLTPQGVLMAAVLACGPGAVVSHRTAADVHGLRIGGTSVEVSVASSGRRGPGGVLLHQPRHLDRCDCSVVDGIPVTTVARTLVDVAAVVSRRRLERAFDEAERREKIDISALAEVCARSNGRRGVATLRALIAERRVVPETKEELEHRFIELLRAAGIPLPSCNVLIEGVLVDAVWPAEQLVVELDSYGFHRTRAQLERDHESTVKLQLSGWRVVRLTWRMMNADLPATVTRLLAGQGAPPVVVGAAR